MGGIRDDPGRTMIRAGRIFGWTFAVTLFVAAVWFALIDKTVTVPDRPRSLVGLSEPVLRTFFDWYVSTLPQLRVDGLVAIVAFLALIGLALCLRELGGGQRAAGVLGPAAVSLGSALWIIGNVLQLGGYRAIEIMVEQRRPLDPVDDITIVINTIDDWFELTGFALIGIGLAAIAASASQSRVVPRSWAIYTFVLAGASIAVSAAYIAERGTLIELSLFGLGIVLAPVWGIWTAHVLGRSEARRHS
jgi:hypothetical protein